MRHIVVGTAGHIDHGKSALVFALTGTDPDRLKEEKARGITIDLGFAHAVLDDLDVAFVDVPGHERFVRNMLAGVTGIDGVLLAVAADESVMPQTREHFDICALLGIGAGVVALTKADLVDADTLELVALEVRELVQGSFLDGAPIVPVSARTGAGLDALRHALVGLASRVPRRDDSGATRLPVDRVFSVRGFGTVVTGTLTSGRVAVDDALLVLPTGRPVKVRGVQVHGLAVGEAGAGQRVAVNLAGIEVDDLGRGATLVTAGAFAATRRFDAVIDVLRSAGPLRHGARVRVHHGTSEILGRLSLAGPLTSDASAGELAPGSRGFVRVRLEAPATLTRGDRVIVRAYSPPVTVAGGRVIDPQPLRGPLRTPAGRARLRRLAGDERAPGETVAATEAALQQMLEEAGLSGLPASALRTRLGLSASGAAAVVAGLSARGRLATAGERVFAAGVAAELEGRVLHLLAAHHAAQPLSGGLPREEVRGRSGARGDAAIFDVVVSGLVTRGSIVARERLALATHRVALSAADDAAMRRVDQAFREAGLRPPEPAGLAATLGIAAAVADQALRLLQRQRTLVKLDTLLFHAAALERLKAEVRALKEAAPDARLDVATFKDRFGVSRKFAIPLLEYLDRERVTRRVGESRMVL